MYDILPFPNITATDAKEQVSQINNYLIQLKEELEFILTNISADNLSPELLEQIRSLGAEVKTTKEEQLDATQQITQKMIGVTDVVTHMGFLPENPNEKLYTDVVYVIRSIAQYAAQNGQRLFSAESVRTALSSACFCPFIRYPGIRFER